MKKYICPNCEYVHEDAECPECGVFVNDEGEKILSKQFKLQPLRIPAGWIGHLPDITENISSEKPDCKKFLLKFVNCQQISNKHLTKFQKNVIIDIISI
mgnify:CR=1 FL=1